MKYRFLLLIAIGTLPGYAAGRGFSKKAAVAAKTPLASLAHDASAIPTEAGDGLKSEASAENRRALSALFQSSNFTSPEVLLRLCHELEHWKAEDFAAFASGNSDILKSVDDDEFTQGRNTFRETVLRALAERWVEIDRAGAIAWMNGIEDDASKLNQFLSLEIARTLGGELLKTPDQLTDTLAAAALEGFAISKPNEARAWFASLPDEKKADLRESLILGLAVSAPDDAFALLEPKEREAKSLSNLLRKAISVAEDRGPAALMRIAELVPTKSVREAVAQAMLDQAPEQAAQALSTWELRDNFFGIALKNWAYRSPQEAITFLKQSGIKNWGSYSGRVLGVWATRSPAEAVEWLDASGLSGADRDSAIREIGAAWCRRDIDAATHWLEAQNSPAAEAKLAGSLAEQLSRSGRNEEAERLILTLSPDEMLPAAASILNGNTYVEPAFRASLGLKISEASGKPKALRIALENWVLDSRQTAEKWFQNLPETNNPVLVMLAWIGANPSATLDEYTEWIGRISDPWQRSMAVEFVLSKQHKHSPQKSHQWLKVMSGLDPEYQKHLEEVYR